MLNKVAASGPALHFIPDPLDDDARSDVAHATTDRRLVRLVTVAADVGARFEREGISVDPVAWMLAPRVLFDGRRPLDACQTRDGFLSATLLHGLGLGLDAHPETLAALLEEDEPLDNMEADNHASDAEYSSNVISGRFENARRALYTCIVVDHSGPICIQAFYAMVATGPDAVAAQLRIRFGESARGADIREGFDRSAPLVDALVSDSTAAMLEAMAADPNDALGAGFDMSIEQRFAA